jgi:hypothetical protein
MMDVRSDNGSFPEEGKDNEDKSAGTDSVALANHCTRSSHRGDGGVALCNQCACRHEADGVHDDTQTNNGDDAESDLWTSFCLATAEQKNFTTCGAAGACRNTQRLWIEATRKSRLNSRLSVEWSANAEPDNYRDKATRCPETGPGSP